MERQCLLVGKYLGLMEGDVDGEDDGGAVPLVVDLLAMLEGEEVGLVEGEEDVDGELVPLVWDLLGLHDGEELQVIEGEDDGLGICLEQIS